VLRLPPLLHVLPTDFLNEIEELRKVGPPMLAQALAWMSALSSTVARHDDFTPKDICFQEIRQVCGSSHVLLLHAGSASPQQSFQSSLVGG